MAVFFIMPIAFGEIVINREMPTAVEVKNTVNVSIDFRSTELIDAFDIVEFVPLGWEVSNWQVYNYDTAAVVLEKEASYQYQGKERTAFHWSFRDGLGSRQVLLVYEITATSSGSQEFISVWTYPGGFDTSTRVMSVFPGEGVIFCGNDICELGETSFSCPQDCPKINIEVRDVTLPLIIFMIAAAIIAIWYIYAKYFKDMIKKRAAVEDIRTYLKLGLRRGYNLREMTNTLHGEGVDVNMIQALIEQEKIKDLETSGKKIYPEEEVIQKIKNVVEELSEEDKDNIYEDLGISRMSVEKTKVKKIVRKAKKTKKRVKKKKGGKK